MRVAGKGKPGSSSTSAEQGRHRRARAGPALDGVRARLSAIGPLLRRLHQHGRATPGSSSTGGRSAMRPTADPAPRREVLAVDQPYANHNGGLRPVRPRRQPLHRVRRRRLGRRPGAQRPGPRRPARQDAADRPRGRPAASPYGIPADNPFADDAGAQARDPRLSACATRGASRSTARPATYGSATSARTSRRRSTSERDGSRAPTSAGRPSRGRPSSTTTRRHRTRSPRS